MSIVVYIAVMILSTLLSWVAFGMVVSSVNPQAADLFGIFLFYGSLTLALTGVFALIGFFVRTMALRSGEHFYCVLVSFRQGLFFAVLIDGFLIMQHLKLLTWYNAAFLIIALTLAEFFAISRRTIKV